MFGSRLVSEEVDLMTPALSMDELCAHADAVVIAEVTTLESAWSVTKPVDAAWSTTEPVIETHVHAAVTRVLVGPPTHRMDIDGVEMVLPGGSIGSLTLWVEDAARLAADHRYGLFLIARDAETWGILGGEQGALELPFGSPETQDAFLHALSTCTGRPPGANP
jgi:hypothetical protein